MAYDDVIKAWKTNPESFWTAAASDLDWLSPWEHVCDTSRPSGTWFTKAQFNTCHNALDRHIDAGRGNHNALIYDSAMTDTIQHFTYTELRDEVAVLAGALLRAGINKGDRVLIYMPMIPQAVMAMLACARIGAIHSVVFGGFAADELGNRISQAKPKLILAASCGLEPGRTVEYKPLIDAAIEKSSHQPEHTVVWQRPECVAKLDQKNDQDWNEFTKDAELSDCVPVLATDPLYTLYTSGTTGKPKGIVRDNGGHAVAMHWSMKNIYNIDKDDVYWAASDIGWVVGHSYIVYAPLLAGATTILYEGKPVGTPDASAFWRVVDNHKVNVLFTAPTAIRAIKRVDSELKMAEPYDLSSLRALFLAGERCDPDTLNWSAEKLSVPVIDHWWQTETGWAISGNLLGENLFATRSGSAGKAMPGWDVKIVNDACEELGSGEVGAIVCKLPLGPGAMQTLWEAEDHFQDTYFKDYPGYYKTGDAGYIDDQNYLHVMSRTDDIINVAGHRLSTGALEEVLATHPAVAECAVTGVHDDLKGQVPLGFLCLKADANTERQQVIEECIAKIRDSIGPVAAFKRAVVVERLPKTRSGKILRAVLSKLADGKDVATPPTIDDPAILDEIKTALQLETS